MAIPSEDQAAEKLRSHLRWFLIFRVLIISCFLGTVAFLHFAAGDIRESVPINWLLATIGLSYGVTLASMRLLPTVRRLELFTYLQIGVDALLITGAVLLTGGTDSPFPFLYSLTIFNAAILLHARGAAIASLVASVTYTSFVLSSAGGLLPFAESGQGLHVDLVSRLLLDNASFFIIAYLAGVLTQRLHDTTELLAQKSDEHERLSHLQDALTRHVGCGLVTADADGQITSANTVAAELAGRTVPDMLGQSVGTVFPPLRLTAEARLAFLQSTSQEAIEFRTAPTEETSLLVRCSATALRDTYNHAVGAIYVLQDVTVLRDLEQRYRDEGEAALASAENEIDEDDGGIGTDGFVGRSPELRHIRALIDKVAPSDATVLLQGESGTGKEVAARAVHAKSDRRDKPFIPINCGAIPEHLIESELFGHVKGAFTGAVANRPGFFRVADGGTVFLDEIAELPLLLQVKLLRVLQERVFKPVGSETHVAVDVRVIAATNKDLLSEVKAGRFREDLYYRLNVISIDLPPLRDRSSDVPLLIRHFLRQFSELHDKRVVRLSVPAARRLVEHSYPGNVRELANIIEHAVTMCEGETVHEVHLPQNVLEPPRRAVAPRPEPEECTIAPPPVHEAAAGSSNGSGVAFSNLDHHLEEYEKRIILKALDDAGGVKKRAADILGINYRSFRHRLSKYGLNGSVHGDEV